MSDQVFWTVRATIHDGKVDALKALTESFVAQTRNEPGTLAYQWSISEDNSTLHIYERYTDSDAALAHLGAIGPLLPKISELVTITGIDCYGAPAEAFRQAVAEMPFNFFGTYAGFHR